jgi:hypothetical protein
MVAISIAGVFFYYLTKLFFADILATWTGFILISFIIGLLLGLFAWMFFLRKEFSEYVPVRFKKYFLFS